jgi:putative transposase
MLRLLAALVPALRSAFRSRGELLLENIALRQQLATLVQRGRPRIRAVDRAFWIALRRVWSRWADIIVIVKPETVVAWHRAGFRLYWRWLSRKGKRAGRQPLAREVRDLIRRMATENLWGAPRIHGELLELGFEISERTVSRYLRTLHLRPRSRQTWSTFLKNHRDAIVAMDLFTVPTATFRLLYVLFVIRHARREVIHWNITANPTATWVIQQMREAFPFDAGSRYLLFDRDSIFCTDVVAVVRSMAMKPTRTSYRSPWQNGVAERFVGTLRRELLDRAIVLNEHHLHRLLEQFIAYYHHDRTHLGLGKETPLGRPIERQPELTSNVVGLPRVGGLHHRYAWRRAA